MTSSLQEFSGEELFQADPRRLYDLLTDLDSLAASIPDLVSAERTGEHSLKCVVRPGFSFLRGTMKLAISLADLVPPKSATMQVAAQGIGVGMRLASNLAIEPEGTGSRLFWTGRIEEMTGLITSVSPALVSAAAQRTIRHAWQQVRQRLGEAAA